MKRLLFVSSDKDTDDNEYGESIFIKIEGDELKKYADRYLHFFCPPSNKFVIKYSIIFIVPQISTIMWSQLSRFILMNPMKFTMTLLSLYLRFPSIMVMH